MKKDEKLKIRGDRFIEKAKIKHESKYDYLNVKYINSATKVYITCPMHGDFLQSPSNHLAGNGCPKCAGYSTVKMNTGIFISRSKEKHGDLYDYSKSIFKSSKKKLKIICPIHGEFEQAPYHHMNGHGCMKCNRDGRSNLTTREFIEKCQEIHSYKYEYSLVNYIHNLYKVRIICPIHGEFEQLPRHHMHCESGCNKCAKLEMIKKRRLSHSEFINKCNNVHNGRYDYSKSSYNGLKNKIKIKCPDHGYFLQTAGHHINGSNCPKCSVHISKMEEYIKELLRNETHVHSNRKVISPLELDFYLPDHNLAIECNGIYWHSELAGKDKNYHLNKTKQCQDKGIQLIHINENEFINKNKIVYSKLNSILNNNKKHRIHGRKCEVREIDSKLKSKFLNKYHLQGNDKASVKLGLFYNNRLVSVMTFCKRRVALGKKSSKEGEYELSRFCGNFNFYTIGGASKLLKYFERNYNPSKIVTYADKRWSKGDVYFKLGFKHTHDSKPNYWYFYKNDKYNIKHRFSYRKSELKEKLDKFDPNKTEWQNMRENGWNRIWDCGNMVFEKLY